MKREIHDEKWVCLSDDQQHIIQKERVISKDNYILLYKKKQIENIDAIIEENIDVFSNKRIEAETIDVVYESDVDVSSKKKARIENRKDIHLKNKETNQTDDLVYKNIDYISSHDDVSNNNSIIKTFHSLPTKSKPTASAVLSSTYRGCSIVFQPLLLHLSGKRGQLCRA